MTQFLPPNLLALFAPRDPIPYMTPPDKLPHEKKRPSYLGLAQYISSFEDPKDTPEPPKLETREEKKERKRKEKAELQAYKIEQGIALWDPANNESATTDPYKTLFVGRINFETSESKLRRELEAYGPVKRVIMVYDKQTGKPRGFAFVEFEKERDMHAAYKHADGRKIDGRRVLVDVERGRTVKGWLPRRLGGGLGNTRRAKAPDGEPVREEIGRRPDDRRDDRRDRDKERERGPERERERERERRPVRSREDERPPVRRRSHSRSRDRDRRPREPITDRRERDREPRRGRSRERERERDRDRGDKKEVRVKEEGEWGEGYGGRNGENY